MLRKNIEISKIFIISLRAPLKYELMNWNNKVKNNIIKIFLYTPISNLEIKIIANMNISIIGFRLGIWNFSGTNKIKITNITDKAIFGELVDSKLSGMLHYKEISYDENIII